ncbi:hypothetical protein HMPREF1624_01733 [Sporothrix schenckii ATCC 58251]|uniref:Px domain containing protein n=1 Tax=Sporothrix schenckii (strain ATCC 58251 / de Perez 2211183) TaxID=1391915 RepID=U7Q6J1_SPOS1|nr:hypothetical protein HMPREF1624_01733 [Sporothrix schenckii ATCC 58251]
MPTEATDTDAGPPPGRPPANTAAATLSAPQLHALFDILTRYETYYEVQDFRDPDTIFAYGTPFVERKPPASTGNGNRDQQEGKDENDATGSTPTNVVYARQSRSPILHMLFNKTVMTLPPAQTLPPAFWHVRVQGIMAQLAEAELSESYDQGAMGTRKMLATAASALVESLGRGALGGYPAHPTSKQDKTLTERTYDTTNAADFARAWDDVLRAAVYDNLVDELFAYAATHPDMEGHSPAVAAAADYIIVHIAEFLHYVFVLSPNGRYLTKLVDSVQLLVPYSLVRQTLRVSNAATMINGMMKLLLAKLSVGGLTNWIGLTSTADDGMNLLQRIVSLVLSYDASNFKKAADKIEKEKTASKAQLAAIREHLARPRAYHEAVRNESLTKASSANDGYHASMVVAILESVDPSLTSSLTESQHAQLAQYYAALLSVHDRRELTNVFCRQSPDLFTQAVRDGVAAFDPIIRGIHDKIDLKEHVSDIEGFINEFIEISKGTKPASKTSKNEDRILPTIKDYVKLLRRNRHLLYKWLHRVAHDTPDIRETFRRWAIETIKMFRGPGAPKSANRDETPTASTERKSDLGDSRLEGSAGAMDPDLRALFASLPADVQTNVVSVLDEQVAYLAALDEAAAQQRQILLDKINAPSSSAEDESASSSSPSSKQAPGSGRFIARWQELLDDNVIGPGTAYGPLRHGKDVAHITAPGKTGASPSGAGNSGGPNGLIGGGSNASSSKSNLRKFDGGFLSGISSALSSRNTSPERTPTPIPASAATPGRIDVGPRPPNVLPVVDALGTQFRQLLVERTSRANGAGEGQ